MDKKRASCYQILLLVATASAIFTDQQMSQPLTINPMMNCAIRAAKPVKIVYNDFSNSNCINAKLRINEPFGLYTPRDGFVKWETLYGAFDCEFNYFYHYKCNITAVIPKIENSLEFDIWNNCSWRYTVDREPKPRHHSTLVQNLYSNQNKNPLIKNFNLVEPEKPGNSKTKG